MSMYDKLEAQLHDFFWASEGEPDELPLLENFLNQYPGTALELGCGSGRLLLPLLKKGYLMEGLDNSADMLEICRKQSLNLDPILHQAGISDFSTGSTYAAIAIPAFTLQLLPYSNISHTLTNIHRHLHPDGGLYITTFIPWAEITGQLEEGKWYLDHESKLPTGETARCHTHFTINRFSQKLVRKHRYELLSQDDELLEASDSTHHLTWFWPRELQEILHHTGFEVKRTLGDFDFQTPCDEDSQIITVFAQS